MYCIFNIKLNFRYVVKNDNVKYLMFNPVKSINYLPIYMKKLSLKLGSFNIHGGLNEKYKDPYFIKLVKCCDIICIPESWLVENNTINIDGYNYYRSDRFKGKKHKQGHGGIVVFYKKELKNGLTKIPNKNSDVIWFKLCKKFFGFKKDLYIASAYIQPANSFVHKETDIFHAINCDVVRFGQFGEIMILGDVNGRISNDTEVYTQDFLAEDSNTFQYKNKRYSRR